MTYLTYTDIIYLINQLYIMVSFPSNMVSYWLYLLKYIKYYFPNELILFLDILMINQLNVSLTSLPSRCSQLQRWLEFTLDPTGTNRFSLTAIVDYLTLNHRICSMTFNRYLATLPFVNSTIWSKDPDQQRWVFRENYFFMH